MLNKPGNGSVTKAHVYTNLHEDREKKQKRFSNRKKMKNEETTVEDSNLNIDENIINKNDDSDNESDDPNRANTRKKVSQNKQYSLNEKRGRGRPKRGQEKQKLDNEYTPQRALSPQIKKRKVDDSSKSNKPINPILMVKCGKCQVELKKSQWQHHNLYTHNDLSWLDGTEKPNYDNDEKLLKKVLAISIKKRKGHLVCETCSIKKRSVAGYLSHLMFCGKGSEEIQALLITCPECNATMKPSSLEYHERMHRTQLKEKKKILDIQKEKDEINQRSKRKAAEKAISKISEFNELIEDEKDNAPGKKSKLNSISLKRIIEKPKFSRKLSGMLLKKWKLDLLKNKRAYCNQIGCQYSSDLFDELKNHYSTCNFMPLKNFICKICKFESSSENEIFQHAYQNHSLEDKEDPNLCLSGLSEAEPSSNENSDDEQLENILYNENEITSRSFIYKKTDDLSSQMFKFLFKHGAYYNKYTSEYLTPFLWTLDFELRNYNFHLFKEYIPNVFRLLNSKEAINYIPEHNESMLTMNKKYSKFDSGVETTWKRWKRFEGQCVQDNPTFFTGGPVWAMAWLPIPTFLTFSKDVYEYIAISTHSNMDKEYDIGKAHSGKNIIQIWCLGSLDKKSETMLNPELAYAIAHEGGTVWCLEWCPSGCYQHENLPNFIKEENNIKRIGLLAAACSDGSIRIYSLIFPENLPKHSNCSTSTNDSEGTENRYPVYNNEPSLILIINVQMYDNKKQTWQVTKLSWSKENGHNTIVAGFSNGYVALWDLSTKNQMLKIKRGKTTLLMPYRHFLAHQHAVTMVNLVSQDKSRFLATASMDRLYKFWDLEDITSSRNSFKKSMITGGVWLDNWCCCFIASDDALNKGHNYLHCLPLRDYTYRFYNLLPSNSASYAVSGSDLGNNIAYGTLAGEVLAIFPHQLLYFRNMEQTLPRKRFYSVVSTTEVVDFQKEKNVTNEKIYNFMPSSYDNSKDRFGLKFCDKMSNFQKSWDREKYKITKKSLSCEEMDEVPVEQYPFMSVNRVAWSPNARSFLWLAAGYQNGFVRLIPFKAQNLKTTLRWNNLLKTHINNTTLPTKNNN